MMHKAWIDFQFQVFNMQQYLVYSESVNVFKSPAEYLFEVQLQ